MWNVLYLYMVFRTGNYMGFPHLKVYHPSHATEGQNLALNWRAFRIPPAVGSPVSQTWEGRETQLILPNMSEFIHE